MADVTLTYKGSDILELSDSGSATLKTGGKYCEDDIAVEYVKPSGGSSVLDLDGVYTLQISYTESARESFIANVPKLKTLYIKQTPIKEIHLTGFNSIDGIDFGETLANSHYDSVEIIDLDGANIFISASSFRYRPHLKTLNAKVKVLNTNFFLTGCSALETIFFQNNATTISFTIANGTALSDASLVSCANGLSDTVASTLTTTANQKTSLNSIMGTVSQVTDEDSNTYDFFTADENGTVTLMDFITNTKGWTVA